MPKNSNLLPDPGKPNPRGTTFDNQLIELESVDSTNNYAMACIHAGMASNGWCCIAREQTAGKGQRGRRWLSEPGSNLIMSLVLEPPPLKLAQQFLFSATVALAILDQVHPEKNGKWSVKWPNDIYWNDRKAAGILIENLIRGGEWLYAVIGIGINLNQDSFPSEIPNPVSLRQLTGISYNPAAFARELIPRIQDRVTRLGENQDGVLSEFNHFLYKKGQPVSLKKGRDLILTRLTGVDEKGSLITENGTFELGEVEFKINMPNEHR